MALSFCSKASSPNSNFINIVLFRKISTLLPRMVLWFKCLHPFGNFSLVSYLPLKSFRLYDPPPLSNFQWPSLGWVWIFSGTTHFMIKTWKSCYGSYGWIHPQLGFCQSKHLGAVHCLHLQPVDGMLPCIPIQFPPPPPSKLSWTFSW